MLRLITADERLAEASNINAFVLGPFGIGKTFQARYLENDGANTLFVNLEAGMLSLNGETKCPLTGRLMPPFRGVTINVREEANKAGCHPWFYARGLACLLSGPDPSDNPEDPYSVASYNSYAANIAHPDVFAPFKDVFWDSLSVAGRLSFEYAQRYQPLSEKTGKPDTRGAYGTHGLGMVKWATQIQHTPGKSAILSCILDRKEDDLKRVTYQAQIPGAMSGDLLPGIFDQVLTLTNFFREDGTSFRGFVTKQDNPYGVPAKDRSGCLELVEPADLGALMRKIRAGQRLDGQPYAAVPKAA